MLQFACSSLCAVPLSRQSSQSSERTRNRSCISANHSENSSSFIGVVAGVVVVPFSIGSVVAGLVAVVVALVVEDDAVVVEDDAVVVEDDAVVVVSGDGVRRRLRRLFVVSSVAVVVGCVVVVVVAGVSVIGSAVISKVL